MLHLSWQRLRSDWPVFFAIGVALYIACSSLLQGIHVTPLSVDKSSSENGTTAETSHATTTTTAAPVGANGLSVEVQSFRLAPKGTTTAEADFTLVVRNRAGGEIDLHPNRFLLRRTGTASTVAPSEESVDTMTVLKGVPQVVPLTFMVSNHYTGSYDLLYGNQVVYSGRAG
jgi:hypothetical protein